MSLYQLNNRIEIVGCFYWRIAELALFVFMIVDSDIRIFKRMSRKHAGNTLVRADYSLGSQMFQSCNSSG